MPRAKPMRRRASAADAPPAPECAGVIPLKAGGQLTMIFEPSSAAADRARVSRRAMLQLAIEAVLAEAEAASAFADWRAHCLIAEAGAQVDQDEAFVSFWRFCEMVDLTGPDRLAHSEFVIAMTAAGHPLGVSRDGRKFHRGCRLADRFGGVVPIRGVAEVGLFISERCKIGGTSIADRGRSLAIYEAYRAWAIARGDQPLTIVRFGKALKARGFRRIHSNGRWWQGLKLAETVPPAGRP